MLTVFCCNISFAQQTVSPEKQALIREFFEASGGQKSANEMVEVMISFQEKEMPKTISSLIENDKNLTPTKKQELKRMTTESTERIGKRFREFFTQRINIGQMLEEISLPVYDKNLTDTELRDLITFYRSPTGQKMIAVAPKMALEAMMAFSEKFSPKLQEFMKETAEAELAELKQKLQSGKGKKTVRKS
ncbi:MAG: DUF2059 domain-containing protein [Pyrinomonadaceae bacterium]